MEQKLDVGNVFERIFAVYKDQFTLLVPAALIVFIPVALLNGVLRESGGVLLAVAAIVIGAIATYWFQGMVVEAAHDIMDGRRDHTVGSLLSAVTPVIGPLLVAGFLGGLATGIGFVLLIVPGLFLMTIWALIAPVIVIERTDAMSSFGRSRALVKDHGWQVLAVLIVLLLLKLVLSAVVAAILIAIADSVVSYVAADLITNVLIAPLSALAAAVLYFELRRLHGETPLPATPAYAPPDPGSPMVAPAPGPEAPVPADGPQAPPPPAPESP